MRCHEDQVQAIMGMARDGIVFSRAHYSALADLAADWLEMHAEIERYREREQHFAKALQVADGGDYRADWDVAIKRVVSERDSLRKRLADAEATERAAIRRLVTYEADGDAPKWDAAIARVCELIDQRDARAKEGK